MVVVEGGDIFAEPENSGPGKSLQENEEIKQEEERVEEEKAGLRRKEKQGKGSFFLGLKMRLSASGGLKKI